MSEEQSRTVWCLVDLERSPAPVRVPGDAADVDYLKEAIRDKCEIRAASYRVVLWKVSSTHKHADSG